MRVPFVAHVMWTGYGPKEAGHPSVGKPCPACHEPFVEGDYTALIPLGPGSDSEARQARDRGAAYNAVAVEVHFDCASAEARER